MVILLACAPGPATLGDEDLLVRTSLDLRGVRPSAAELQLLREDPGLVDELVLGFLRQERLPERVRALWADVYRTRSEDYHAAEHFGLDDEDAWQRSVGEEPLRVLGEVVARDLPVSELVTGDWTMVDAQLAGVHPVGVAAPEQGWVPARYTDGRPAAGVLGTNGLWWRYTSTESNAHRERANALSRIFLCEDYLERPVAGLGEALAAGEDALEHDPACVGCHVGLDGLAGHLYGFTWYAAFNAEEQVRYYPERELLWEDWTGVAPSFYGTPTSGLAQLGELLAADPRFTACQAEQAFELLVGRDATIDDHGQLARHTETLEASGLRLPALLGSVVASDAYAAGARLVTAELLASQVEALTGHRWTRDGVDLLTTDQGGLRVLAGGSDGDGVPTRARRANTTLVLVQQRLAEHATAHVEADGGLPEGPDVEAGLSELHLRVFGRDLDDDTWLDLWHALEALDGAEAAWAGVHTAMLRDPELLVY